jgi:uncharacterized protein YcfL
MPALIQKHLTMLAALLLAACTAMPSSKQFNLAELPTTDEFCLTAQRVVARTTLPMQLQLHDDLTAFIKSKTNIEGPTIHQFNWYDDAGQLQGHSCKMKSGEHLNRVFGPNTAGPEGICRDMSEQVYGLVNQQVQQRVFQTVVFESNERRNSTEPSNMIGPQWLLPLTLTDVDAIGSLHVRDRGFVIEFSDPRFQRMPPTWRGTHYCHFIAPAHLAAVLQGEAQPGATISSTAPRAPMVPVDE